MEFRLNSRRFFDVSVNPDTNNHQEKSEQKQPKLLKTTQHTNFFENVDVSSQDVMANYAKAGINMRKQGRHNLPDGLSEYRYNGSRYTIYKHGDRYRSEFIGRHGIDKAEFFSHFDELQPMTKSLKDNSSSTTITDVNGAIDGQVLQGNTGDCWLLTALEAMSSTEEGKNIISDSITINDNNTVTVTFKGIGVSYTLTADEIAKYDTDNNTSDSYSNGDNDALIMELAVEKLWKDINSGKVILNTNNEDITYTDRSIDGGGLPVQMIYYLTGIESSEYYHEDLSDLSKNEVYQVLSNALEKGNTAVNFGIYYNEHSAKLIDGSTYSLDVEDGGHALAITNITSDTVTFVNPWDSKEEYTMSWSEFASLGIGYMSCADLTQTNYASEITDMSGNNDSTKDNESYEWREFPDNHRRFDDFEPITPPHHHDDYFRPSPFEPKGFEPDNINDSYEDEISEIDNKDDGIKDSNFYSFSFDDIIKMFLDFLSNYFSRI